MIFKALPERYSQHYKDTSLKESFKFLCFGHITIFMLAFFSLLFDYVGMPFEPNQEAYNVAYYIALGFQVFLLIYLKKQFIPIKAMTWLAGAVIYYVIITLTILDIENENGVLAYGLLCIFMSIKMQFNEMDVLTILVAPLIVVNIALFYLYEEPTTIYLVEIILITMMAVILAITSERYRRKNFLNWLQLQETIGLLEANKQELSDLNNSLESRVIERTQALEEAQEQLYIDANLDHLTRLPNRRRLTKVAEEIIQGAASAGEQVAFFFIDLDRFKEINDTLGHKLGDELLCEIADRLVAHLADTDVVARVSGDEFIIIVPSVGSQPLLVEKAKFIQNKISDCVLIAGNEIYMSASIGISLYPDHGKSLDGLQKRADAAMYEVKNSGKNNFCIFDKAIEEKVERAARLERDLRGALDRNELYVVYQPKVHLATQKYCGAEALIRWEHPDLGFISPIEFIPLAEEAGLIDRIGDYVLLDSIEMLKVLNFKKDEPFSIAINMSPLQLERENCLDSINRPILHSGLSASRFEFELTESAMLKTNETHSFEILKTLRRQGYRINIDDFGTGYSSLSYLQMLPVDVVKIDQSFVRDLTEKAANKVIVESVIKIAATMDLTVVAEGVETKEICDYLTSLGCELAQGYFFSKPISSKELKELLSPPHGAG
ncbi:EAL domain-containing protein [Temperatibacter marinus]|uniref:EAL domain-containing protein n=1 Tax=Temperatibacter marinus TaxID=1456591 RepID=A0AA52EHA5_9PROT|nr:EAL domain-containing protein [Temperatibacter marinus]WND02770.1 EAL domain-containing protein [Temperatibacter marinus]